MGGWNAVIFIIILMLSMKILSVSKDIFLAHWVSEKPD